MQRKFNNTSSTTTKKSSNEICYDFISCININFISNDFTFVKATLIRLVVQNSIAFSQALFKKFYDKQHKNCQLQIDD